MPDPDTEIKRQLPLGSIGEIYRIKTKRACLFYGSEVCEVTHKKNIHSKGLMMARWNWSIFFV